MAIIAWIAREDGSPNILAIFDEITASSGLLNHDRYTDFERKVGRAAAEAALGEYYREQEEAA